MLRQEAGQVGLWITRNIRPMAALLSVLKKPMVIQLATLALLAILLDQAGEIPFSAVPTVLPESSVAVDDPAVLTLVQECDRLRLPEVVDYISPKDVPLQGLRPRLEAAQKLTSWPSSRLSRCFGAGWAVASHDWLTSGQNTRALQTLLATLNPLLRSGNQSQDMQVQGQCMRRVVELLAERDARVNQSQVSALQEAIQQLPSLEQTVSGAYRRWTSEMLQREAGKRPRYAAQILAEMDLVLWPPLLDAVLHQDPANFLRVSVEDNPLVKDEPVMVDLLTDLLQTWFATEQRNSQARVLLVLLQWKMDPNQVPSSPYADVHGRFTPYDATVWADGINGKNENGSEAFFMGSHSWMPPHMREVFTYQRLKADEVYRVGLR